MGNAQAQSSINAATGNAPPASATTTATETKIDTEPRQRGYAAPKVEEAEDE